MRRTSSLLVVLTLAFVTLHARMALAQAADPPTVAFEGHGALTWPVAPGADSYSIDVRDSVNGAPRCWGGQIAGSAAWVADRPAPGHALFLTVHGESVDPATRAVSSAGSCGPRVFVDPAATGAGTGSSWADAYTTITSALVPVEDTSKQLQVWIKGPISEDVNWWFYGGGYNVSYALLGGFDGSEQYVWQRKPLGHPTAWNGSFGYLNDSMHADIVIDGFTITGGAWVSCEWTSGTRARFSNDTFLDGHGIEFDIRESFDSSLTVERTRVEGGGIRVNDGCGNGDVRIVDSELVGGGVFLGSTDDACMPAWISSIDTEILGNRFIGGSTGISWYAQIDENGPLQIDLTGLISGNEFRGVGAPIRLSGDMWQGYYGGRSLLLRPRIVGNTIYGAAGDAVSCSIFGYVPPYMDPDPEQTLRCDPVIEDNIIADSGGYAIREPADQPDVFAYSAAVAAGNLFFGNAGLYIDGNTPLETVDVVNQRAGFFDNFVADPRFVNAPAGDLHLSPDSPAIDRGHASYGSWAYDVDGQPRGGDGNGDGTAAFDVGADEFLTCPQDCAAQADTTKQSCEQALVSRLNEFACQLQSCLAVASNPVQRALCQDAYGTTSGAAEGAYRACVTQAGQAAWTCTRACPASRRP